MNAGEKNIPRGLKPQALFGFDFGTAEGVPLQSDGLREIGALFEFEVLSNRQF
jgi:hypothetical protein